MCGGVWCGLECSNQNCLGEDVSGGNFWLPLFRVCFGRDGLGREC